MYKWGPRQDDFKTGTATLVKSHRLKEHLVDIKCPEPFNQFHGKLVIAAPIFIKYHVLYYVIFKLVEGFIEYSSRNLFHIIPVDRTATFLSR